MLFRSGAPKLAYNVCGFEKFMPIIFCMNLDEKTIFL